MSEVLFDIVFKGKFVNQIDKPKAVLHFSKLFKMPIEKAERYFDGVSRTLKKSLTLDKASHFRASLKKAGLRVSMAKQVSQESEQAKSAITMSEVGAILVNKAFIQPKHFDTNQFTLDEVGVEIVHPEAIEKVNFDIDQISMDEIGAIMAEKKHQPEPEVDISQLTMEEVGSIIAEKKHIPEPEFDLTSIEIDEVGAQLVEKKAIPEPEINIDDIELAD
jgi:hypothetical protein